MSGILDTWRGAPWWAQALTALPLLVLIVMVATARLVRRSAGEAVADEAEDGADEAEARADELVEDLEPTREAEDARRSDLTALAQHEAGERYDRHAGLHGLDPFGGEK